MKKFTLHLTLFILPLLLGAYFVDLFISNNLKKAKSDEFEVWHDIFGGMVNADLIIHGSSRALSHFDTNILSRQLNISSYNLGINGHNFWLQYLRHILLLKYNAKPKIIIVSLDMVTLEKRRDLYDFDQFLPYMLNDKLIENATASYDGFNYFDYHLPLIRYAGKASDLLLALKLFILPRHNPRERLNGYHGHDSEWNNDFANAKKKMPSYEVKVDPASYELFDKYLAECRRVGIHVILVYSPEYIEGQKFLKNRAAIISLYESFSKKYHIPFYDFSNDPISYQKQYFYNAQHLNRKGAELFTKKLCNRLKKDLNVTLSLARQGLKLKNQL